MRTIYLEGLQTAASAPTWTIARNQHLIAIAICGDIDDAISEAWRAAMQASFDSAGYPPFGFVDAIDSRATNSLSTRMHSAAFLRNCARHMQRIAVCASAPTGFAVRAMMRVAGMGNVCMVDDDKAPAVWQALRAGRDIEPGTT